MFVYSGNTIHLIFSPLQTKVNLVLDLAQIKYFPIKHNFNAIGILGTTRVRLKQCQALWK